MVRRTGLAMLMLGLAQCGLTPAGSAFAQRNAPRFTKSGVIEKIVPGGCVIRYDDGEVMKAVVKDRSAVHVRAESPLKEVPLGALIAVSGKLHPQKGTIDQGIIAVLLFDRATPRQAFSYGGSGILSGEPDGNGAYSARIVGRLVRHDPIVIEADRRNSSTTLVRLPNGRSRQVPTMAFGGKKFEVNTIREDDKVDVELGSAAELVDEGARCTAFGILSNPPVIDSLRVTRKEDFDFKVLTQKRKK